MPEGRLPRRWTKEASSQTMLKLPRKQMGAAPLSTQSSVELGFLLFRSSQACGQQTRKERKQVPHSVLSRSMNPALLVCKGGWQCKGSQDGVKVSPRSDCQPPKPRPPPSELRWVCEEKLTLTEVVAYSLEFSATRENRVSPLSLGKIDVLE